MLCLDLRPTDANSCRHLGSMSAFLGLGRGTSDRRGPQFLPDTQVDREAIVQGIYSRMLSYAAMRSKLENRLKHGVEHSQSPIELNWHNEESNRPVHGSRPMILDLCSNSSTMLGQPPNMQILVPPVRGPISIDVTICGLMVLARISNKSLSTMFSK